MLKKLEDMNIVIGKPPASKTEITQPWDIQHCFKGPKTALKHINDSDVEEISKSWLLRRLDDVYSAHQEKYGELPANHKKLFKFGIIRVQTAFVNSMRSQMIIESFIAAAVYPYDPLQILKNCKTPISDALTQTISEKISQLAKRLWREGELADEDFVRAGITRAEDEVIKDLLVIYQRRSCLLTCKALVTREH